VRCGVGLPNPVTCHPGRWRAYDVPMHNVPALAGGGSSPSPANTAWVQPSKKQQRSGCPAPFQTPSHPSPAHPPVACLCTDTSVEPPARLAGLLAAWHHRCGHCSRLHAAQPCEGTKLLKALVGKGMTSAITRNDGQRLPYKVTRATGLANTNLTMHPFQACVGCICALMQCSRNRWATHKRGVADRPAGTAALGAGFLQ
jgi:hypothetical protein